MKQADFNFSSKKQSLLTMIVILYCLFILDNLFSRKHWNKDYITVTHNKIDNTIDIKFLFIDYEVGPFGESGYLESCLFSFQTSTQNFPFLKCEVSSQRHTGTSELYVQSFNSEVDLKLIGCFYPPSGSVLSKNKKQLVLVKGISTLSYLTVRLYQPADIDILLIVAQGIWHVTGLNCDDKVNRIYMVLPSNLMNSTKQADSGDNCIHDLSIKKPEDGAIKVYTNDDAIVINGVKPSENIRIYTTTGALVKSIVADRDVLQFSLPAKQMYIVHVGQARYKVAL